MFTVPVCNIFEETMLDGQLCYQADLDRFRNKVEKKKIATEGFLFLLDYNENRMLDEVYDEDNGEDSSLRKNEKDAMIYVETMGENNKLSKPQTLRKAPNYVGYFWSTLAPTCNSAQLELMAKVAPKTIFFFLSPTINIQLIHYLES